MNLWRDPPLGGLGQNKFGGVTHEKLEASQSSSGRQICGVLG